jgi:hypothetical protein
MSGGDGKDTIYGGGGGDCSMAALATTSWAAAPATT